ncbi:MAG: hypothetical protein A4E57_00765 [Syntrophorhabdaceae bacterium PtaU1.Bin034]|nr:MAG: hypothetical protein A4E57_00765 [Syntrophorhabdaceae bacterium PtaU1.Bin034]
MDLLVTVLIGAFGVAHYVVTGSALGKGLHVRLEKIRLRFQRPKAQEETSYHVNFDIK